MGGIHSASRYYQFKEGIVKKYRAAKGGFSNFLSAARVFWHGNGKLCKRIYEIEINQSIIRTPSLYINIYISIYQQESDPINRIAFFLAS